MKAPPCDHALHVSRGKRFPGATNRPTGRYTCEIGVYRIPLATQQEVMGIDWMSLSELSQAIPPAYSKYLANEFGKEKHDNDQQRNQVRTEAPRIGPKRNRDRVESSNHGQMQPL